MSGRFTEVFKKSKRGSSMIAVLSTISITAIIILCASGVALTNYRTSKTVTSLDARYYSAESSQAQVLSVIQDTAKDLATSWNYDTPDYATFFNSIYDVAVDFANANKDTVYNSNYNVETKISQPGLNYSESSYVFNITSTVTSGKDSISNGISKVYKSQITVKAPTKTAKEVPIYEDVISGSTTTVVKNIFNNGYALVCNGSGKNTDWYGLWGNFNTYYTYKVAGTSPLTGNSDANGVFTGSVSTKTNLSKALVTESNAPGSSTGSGVYLKLNNSESKADKASALNYISFFNLETSVGSTSASQAVSEFMDALDVKILELIDAVDRTAASKNRFKYIKNPNPTFWEKLWWNSNAKIPAITLDITGATKKDIGWVNDSTEKYYVKYEGTKDTFGLTFKYKPGDNASQYCKTTDITVYGPSYRIIGNDIYSFQYNISNDEETAVNKKDNRYGASRTYENTYPDHYYKNKWFFIDLGGTRTLYIDNSTSTKTMFSPNTDRTHWFEPLFENSTCNDGWENYVLISKGNIVLDNCYFFVNGNIQIGNAFNMSDCKFFATGDITLDSVYYPEGLLSLETEAGSNTIKQSLYYCEGIFTSNLISRYAMDWVTKTGNTYNLFSNTDGHYFYFDTNRKDCCIPNGNAFAKNVWEYNKFFMPVLNTYYGYLATYRYPTVLKATIIAKGAETITVPGALKEGSSNYTQVLSNGGGYSKTYGTTVSNVSVFLNPNHKTYEVVDCILIEGQIFANGKVYTTNYNYAPASGVAFSWFTGATNRYSASSQLQYQPYHGTDGISTVMSGLNYEILKGAEVSKSDIVSKVIGNEKVYINDPLEITSSSIYAD